MDLLRGNKASTFTNNRKIIIVHLIFIIGLINYLLPDTRGRASGNTMKK
jgi:hypothetical protein